MNDVAAYLFVYGTLRTGFTNPAALQLHQYSRYLGEGSFPGRLYDIGTYPGAIFQPDAQTLVHGSIYELISPPDSLLSLLDEYEGIGSSPLSRQSDEYIRQVIAIQYADTLISCWVYLYNWPVGPGQLILSGDYTDYVIHEQKKYRP